MFFSFEIPFIFFFTDFSLSILVVITDSLDFNLFSVKSLCVQQVGDDGMFMPHLERGKSSELRITLV